jgi:predicted Zn-dependent protease
VTAPLSPQQLVERALAASTTDGCFAIAGSESIANLRWANNTLTTNGVSENLELTVVAIVNGSDGTRSASVSRSATDAAGVDALVAEAEAAARTTVVADDAAELVAASTSADWDAAPVDAPVAAFTDLAAWLGESFAAARAADEGRYGYAEHGISTTYLGSSNGTRLRHAQPAVRVELTGRSGDGSRSAWAGQGASEVAAVDLAALEADVKKRLEWGRRTHALDAGRYDTILPPTAIADLLIDAYWNAGALDAHEGQSVYSKAGGGTRIGERLTDLPLTMRSDPAMPGQASSPFVLTGASSRMSSVFDNGSLIAPTDWIHDGELAALIQTRHSAALTGLPFTPFSDNLELLSSDASGDIDDLVASMDRGLLLTCLWYIRPVDPQTLLLTGLTRDGVFLVESGEVVGAVNNFRFNESPIGMLKRASAVGRSEATLAREFGDYFTRTRMPAMRVDGFNMSSVSQAS